MKVHEKSLCYLQGLQIISFLLMNRPGAKERDMFEEITVQQDWRSGWGGVKWVGKK